MTKKIFYGWWIVLACFLISAYVGGVVFFGFTAFIDPIREEFGWSHTQISLAVSLRGLEMGVFAPIVGFLVDRYGARMLILFGTITIGFGFILLSLTQSLAMFYGSILFISFGAGGCAAVVLTTTVANWFHKKMGLALGIMGSGVGVGGLLIPLIVWLIKVYQWRTTLVILGFAIFVLGIPLSFVIRNRPEQYGYLPDGTGSRDLTQKKEVPEQGVEITFKQAIKERSFLYLNLAEVIRYMAFSALSVHAMPFLGSMGLPRHTAGLAAGAIPMITIIGRFAFGWLGDKLDKRHLLVCGFFFMSLGMLGFSYVPMGWLMLLFPFFYSTGLGGITVLRGAILREYFGRDSFGKMLGILMGAGSIGGIIGPTLAGWVFDTLGSYHPVWLGFSGSFIIAIILILRIR